LTAGWVTIFSVNNHDLLRTPPNLASNFLRKDWVQSPGSKNQVEKLNIGKAKKEDEDIKRNFCTHRISKSKASA
jgi:hypothetical protein